LNARLANQRDIEPAVSLIAQAREAIIRDIIADSGSTEKFEMPPKHSVFLRVQCIAYSRVIAQPLRRQA
jgi:hypothetical protein